MCKRKQSSFGPFVLKEIMGTWSLLKVNYVPMTLGVVFSFGLVLCFVVSVLTGHVSPYMPFISETGGIYPEAGLFSIFLYLSATLGLSTMFVRYLIVDEMNKGIDRSIDILNRATIIIGFIALMGMVVVAAYPMTTIGTAHGIGANVLFLGCVIYAILQAFLSYKMSPTYNGLLICRIRLIISVLAAIALISMLIIGPRAFTEWNSGAHRHWTGSKLPLDKGFGLMVAASVSEWSMAILFLAYYLTFLREFGKVVLQIRVQLLVEHFDDEPPSSPVRTPLLS